MRLKGRTALVTGGNRGIGIEVCRQLGLEGARILLGSRDPAKGESSADRLRADGIEIRMVQIDMSDPQSVLLFTERLAEHVDILVNNAAVLDRGHLYALDEEQLHYTIRTNLLGPVLLAKHLARR